jgi:hypothetical protein
MGLGNSSHAQYLSVVDGKIARRFKTPTNDTKQRTTSTGKIVYEQFYDHVSGFIKKVSIVNHKDFGDFINIEMVDGEERFILQTNWDGGYSVAFMKVLPNMDFTKRTTIIPSMKMENDKKKVTIFINQGDKALKHFYTKDNPNGLPEMVKVQYRGKEQWDNTNMMKFFKDYLENVAAPKIAKAAGELPSIPQGKSADATISAKTFVGAENQEMEDDLPF